MAFIAGVTFVIDYVKVTRLSYLYIVEKMDLLSMWINVDYIIIIIYNSKGHWPIPSLVLGRVCMPSRVNQQTRLPPLGGHVSGRLIVPFD
jgi:hypothetical protein